MHSLKKAQKKDSTFFKDCTISFSLEKRCYLEKLFSLKLEPLLIIAPFKKCNISKKVVTSWMIWYLQSHRSDRYMCLFLWRTNNLTYTVSLEVIFLLKWSNQAVQKFLYHCFLRNAHDMATNEIILCTGTAWLLSFPTTPFLVASPCSHHHGTFNHTTHSGYNPAHPKLQPPKCNGICLPSATNLKPSHNHCHISPSSG